MFRKIIKHNRLIICLLITCFSLMMTATVFRGAFQTIATSALELWNSLMAYISYFFFSRPPAQSPILPPTGEMPSVLPNDPSEFGSDIARFFKLLVNGQNFVSYLMIVNVLMILFFMVLPFLIMGYYLVKRYIKRNFSKQNNRHNQDTRALKGFKRLSGALYVPPKNYLLSWIEYTKTSRFPRIWLLIWLFNFNIFAVFISFIAVGIYFVGSFDLVALYSFFYNGIAKLLPMFHFIPLWVWLILFLWWVDRWRKRIALRKLRHMERMNTTFILDRSLCSMFVGTMGKGKTTLITDIALSTEAIFRNKAYEMMLDIDLQFPNFPYILLEKELKAEMKSGRVFNLASCGEWIDEKRKFFEKVLRKIRKRGLSDSVAIRLLWDYDFVRYGMIYDDKKTLIHLFDSLKDYVKLYFIYVVNSSLIISNYAIRTDFVKIDEGNMPFWNLDFFQKNTRYMAARSRHSHILDFDMLRLGKKLADNNIYANCFEFGVVAITETGKERGNQFKNIEIKETISQLRTTIKELEKAKADASTHKADLLKLTDRATQLTDKFNDSLKLIRHKCTIGGFPFARVFLDEQRPESLGADARDLCEIVHIKGKSELRLAMPFYSIGELIYAWVFSRFKGTYQEYRINRGDNTLLMYLFKKLGAGVHNSYTRIYNRFGYSIRQLAVEDGATGQAVQKCKYYLSVKKIYSNRFSTDAYGDIFAQELKHAQVGIEGFPVYETHKATEEELKSQNSYFINEITKYRRGANQEDES